MIHPGFTLQPISPGGTYEGPVPGQNQTCHCTSIFYSLISACSACQDGSWIRCVQFNVAYMRISRVYLLCQLDTIPPKLLNQCLLNSVSSTIAVCRPCVKNYIGIRRRYHETPVCRTGLTSMCRSVKSHLTRFEPGLNQ